MKLAVLLALASFVVVGDSLTCGEVECPKHANTCSIKYVVGTKPKKKVTTVTCFNPSRVSVLQQTYESPLTENDVKPPIPDVECGGYRCKSGAYNCTTVTTPSVKADPPIETTHLVCRDEEGIVIEERDIVRGLTLLEAAGVDPPICEGFTCPQGSRRCKYETTINLEPYSKVSHVVCYDIKNRITAQPTIHSR